MVAIPLLCLRKVLVPDSQVQCRGEHVLMVACIFKCLTLSPADKTCCASRPRHKGAGDAAQAGDVAQLCDRPA